jgi:hypothetical protein
MECRTLCDARWLLQFVTDGREQGITKAILCEWFGGPEIWGLRAVRDPPPPGPGATRLRIALNTLMF